MRKELPILFRTDMVKAILEGRKTVTRRVIKNITQMPDKITGNGMVDCVKDWDGGPSRLDMMKTGTECAPYQKGDLLWVRETFLIMDWANRDKINCDHSDIHIQYKASDSNYRPDNKRYIGRSILKHCPEYFDDAVNMYLKAVGNSKNTWHLPWRPSIHMPKWAARLWLEVLDVRAERLQEITEEECLMEGVIEHNFGDYQPKGKASLDGGKTFHPFKRRKREDRFHWQENVTHDHCWQSPKSAFINLWDSLNAKRGYGWDTNPWVWRYEFTNTDTKIVDRK